MTQQTISILGATGSIGDSTLDLVLAHPDKFKVGALTAGQNVEKLAALCRQHQPAFVAIEDESRYGELQAAVAGLPVETACGAEGILAAAAYPADRVMAAITGFAGLAPTLKAVKQGKIVMLANKECLVSAGELFMQSVAASGCTVLPVDSEHNALYQLLDGHAIDDVKTLTLTASGGPFLNHTAEQLADVTAEMAVKHPVWSMGAKISIDSATLINKGLELIEARYLFPVDPAQLTVLIHPQSIIHALVTMHDGSVLAQMGTPDMRIPIAYCLGWPSRLPSRVDELDLVALGQLSFEAPDERRFPCLALARQAMLAGHAMPTVLNAANEIAVAGFQNGQLSFVQIPGLIEKAMEKMQSARISGLEDVFSLDAETRDFCRNLLK